MLFQATNKCQLHAKHHDRCEKYSREEVRCPWRINNGYKKKGEGDSRKCANEGSTNCVICPGLPSVPTAFQALSKFRTFAPTHPLAWNVLPLTPYTAGSFYPYLTFSERLYLIIQIKEGFISAVSHPLSFCMFPSEHLECVLTLLLVKMLIN